jgi:hypothetical protein
MAHAMLAARTTWISHKVRNDIPFIALLLVNYFNDRPTAAASYLFVRSSAS